VLYYFESPKDVKPKGLVPLEDVIVRTSKDRPFSFSLTCGQHEGGLLKSAKAGADGAMSAGKHTAFIFAADNAQERDDWQRALHENIICTRFNKLAGADVARTSSAPR